MPDKFGRSVVEYREPDGGHCRVGPVHPVATVRSDIEPVAGAQKTGIGLVLEAQSCSAGEDQYPFALGLVVPEPGGARLTLRDDPLDAQARARQQRIGAFGGKRVRDGKR